MVTGDAVVALVSGLVTWLPLGSRDGELTTLVPVAVT